jgi:hypothetical protein
MDEVFWARIYVGFHYHHSLKIGRQLVRVRRARDPAVPFWCAMLGSELQVRTGESAAAAYGFGPQGMVK